MMKRMRGFTLIELLVVMVIIGILVSIALPNYMKARDKARESQERAALHVIQMALERYAVDWDGLYPLVLSGGDPTYNNLSMDGGTYRGYQGLSPSPFVDHFINSTMQLGSDALTDPEWCLPFPQNQTVGAGVINGRHICMDSILRQGYLSSYPTNPFAKKDQNGMWAAYSGYGGSYPIAIAGYYGNLMFDEGEQRGEWPWIDWWANDPGGYVQQFGPPSLDRPGNFYYHPYFCDGQTDDRHEYAFIDWNGNTGTNNSFGRSVFMHSVCGYVITGFGAIKTLGIDATHIACTSAYGWQFITGSTNGLSYVVEPSGYFSYEPDPNAGVVSLNPQFPELATCSGSETSGPNNPDYLQARDEVGPTGSGPDGHPDFIIIDLYGGLDKKIAETTF